MKNLVKVIIVVTIVRVLTFSALAAVDSRTETSNKSDPASVVLLPQDLQDELDAFCDEKDDDMQFPMTSFDEGTHCYHV